MPAVPKPAEPCAPRARRWTLSPVSPPPPRSRLRAAAGGPGVQRGPADRSEGGVWDAGPGTCGCPPRGLDTSARCWGKPPPGSPLGADPRLWPQPLSRRFSDGVGGAAQPRAGLPFFFLPPLIEKRGRLPSSYTLGPVGFTLKRL